MGAGRLTVVDPDHVEPTNLNSLAGATDAAARSGTSKTEVAAKLARGIDPDIAVHQVPHRSWTPTRGGSSAART
ncbi:ThiF family adenylyltransferase [Actinomadura algeriensis]|uniref:ThiF family adenylyltransferase n=1 Tax=Actinomadura algeriensis TaxID=1679523 RepID=UPI00384DFCC2